MNFKKAQEKHKNLSQILKEHDHNYYQMQNPSVSDEEYDKLFLQLKTLESDFPELITKDSPSQNVSGKAAQGFQKYTHKVPMLSLDNAFALEDLQAFEKRLCKELETESLEYFCEFKYDGISVALTYKNGIFESGATRGNGTIGEDITKNLQTIRSLPKKLKGKNIPKELIVRGEVYFRMDEFEKLNQNLIENEKEPFANPRNAASGSLRQLNTDITASRHLDIFCYTIQFISNDVSVDSQNDAITYLADLGFQTGDLHIKTNSIFDLEKIQNEYTTKRDQLNYEIDGLVIKLNSLSYQKILGNKARTPRFAIAYKFPSRKEKTTLDAVAFQVGRTGAITPVALLKPVDIGGVTVSRASLHNFDIVEKLGVKIGDVVSIARAGDVIPEIKTVHLENRPKTAKEILRPTCCPICKTKLIQKNVSLLCPNAFACPPQIKWRLVHFASKQALEIKGLGEETIDLFLEKNLIQNPADLFDLTYERLIELEGFQDKKVSNLLLEIQNAANAPIEKQVYALGIESVGVETAKLLFKHLKTFENLENASADTLEKIKGIGPETIESIQDYFNNTKQKNLIANLKKHGFFKQEFQGQMASTKLQDLIFVLTGELKTLKRSQMKKKLESHGAKVTSAVSKKTNYVIAGENAGSKLDKAKKLQIEVLSETQALELIAQKNQDET